MGLLTVASRIGGLIFLVGATATAHATGVADDLAGQPSPIWDETARALMESGRLEEAGAVLEARLATEPKDVQARFLQGMIAVARQDHSRAVRIFRSILIDQPKATRVRIELARAFYLTKDYGNALRQFQLALAGRPPRQVVANINQYVNSIRDSKSVSYSFGLSIAPDTNLNTGSSSREVDLYGLPFDLSEEARQKSGIGLAVEGAVEWAPRIGIGKRLRIGLNGQRREYRGSEFDDMILAAYVGPKLITRKRDLSLLGTANKRWYGGKSYNRAFGVRAEANYHLTPRLGISGALSVQKVTYSRAKDRNGPLMSLNGMTFYALTSSSGVTAKAGLSRQKARLAAYSNWSGFTAAGYFKELPLGFSLYVEPSISLARYDEALPTFGRRRTDVARSVLVTLLNRKLVLTRFTPRISYTYTRQASSVSLYDFTRNRVEIGLTTVF